MTNNSDIAVRREDPAWARARARATAQRDFLVHLVIYVLVNTLLVVIDVAAGTSGSTFLGLDWAFWPIAGWGLGLIIHGFWTFTVGSSWEERRTAQLYEQERQRDLQR